MKNLSLCLIIACLVGIGTERWLSAQSRTGSGTSLQALWVTVEGKSGTLRHQDGRLIFALEASPQTQGRHVVESVGPDHVTIAVHGSGERWRYTIPMDRIELHVFR